MECLEILTQQAINRSSEIEAINQQLALTAERQDYAEARQWTNYLTLDPIRLVQNVLGGGDVQRDRIAISALELETANLIRRMEAVGDEIASEVVDLVLEYEQMLRRGELLAAQLETQRQRQAVQETKYRTGGSSTDVMLRMWQRTGDLEARCDEHRIDGQQVVRHLEIITGSEGYNALTLHWPCVEELLFLTPPSGSATWPEEDVT